MVKDLEAEFTPLFNLPFDFKYLVEERRKPLELDKKN